MAAATAPSPRLSPRGRGGKPRTAFPAGRFGRMTRERRRTGARGWGATVATLLLALGAGCGERSDLRIARRILDNHRRNAGAKPLPGAQVIGFRLSAPAGKDP